MAVSKPRRTKTPRESIPLGLALDLAARRVLIDARKAAKLTQPELAVRLGRPQSYVSRMEQGPLAIDRAYFVAVAHVLAANPEALFAKAIASSTERRDTPGGGVRVRR